MEKAKRFIPIPEGVDEGDWKREDGEGIVKASIDALEKAGVEVESLKSDFIGYVSLRFEGEAFEFSASEVFDVSAVKSFVRRLPEVSKALEKYRDARDIFYSAVYDINKDVYGGSKGRHLGYSFVCGILKGRGFYVHS